MCEGRIKGSPLRVIQVFDRPLLAASYKERCRLTDKMNLALRK